MSIESPGSGCCPLPRGIFSTTAGFFDDLPGDGQHMPQFDPPPHPWQYGRTWFTPAPQFAHPTFPAIPVAAPRLSDEDVERIARRVAELLREPKP